MKKQTKTRESKNSILTKKQVKKAIRRLDKGKHLTVANIACAAGEALLETAQGAVRLGLAGCIPASIIIACIESGDPINTIAGGIVSSAIAGMTVLGIELADCNATFEDSLFSPTFRTGVPKFLASTIGPFAVAIENHKENKAERAKRRAAKIAALQQAGIIKADWDYVKKYKESRKYKVHYIKTKDSKTYAPYFVIKTNQGLKYIKIDNKKICSPIFIDKNNIEDQFKVSELYTIEEINNFIQWVN